MGCMVCLIFFTQENRNRLESVLTISFANEVFHNENNYLLHIVLFTGEPSNTELSRGIEKERRWFKGGEQKFHFHSVTIKILLCARGTNAGEA